MLYRSTMMLCEPQIWLSRTYMKGFTRTSASVHRRTSVPAPARFSALSHMGFSLRRSVLRDTARSALASGRIDLVSTCLSIFNLSIYHLSVHFSVDLIGWPIRLPALLSPPRPPSFVDSLDSELWYRSGCRAAALASSSTEAVGQSFRQLFTTRSALQG